MPAKYNKDIFESFNSKLGEVFSGLEDSRTGSNNQYSMYDIALAGYSVFYMQSPSFLEHQTQMQANRSTNNLSRLFKCKKIPTDNHIRKTLDGVSPSKLNEIFLYGYHLLEKEDHLESYKNSVLDDNLLIALDGTQTHNSTKIRCDNCKVRKHKNGRVDYSHEVLLSTIVSPDKKEVIPMIPEYILPQDGHDKQDCEHSATKRWMVSSLLKYKVKKATILGDDLYSDNTICKAVLLLGYNFIFVCKNTSHTKLYEKLFLERSEEKTLFKEEKGTKRKAPLKEKWHYKYYNNIALNNHKQAIKVNWCDLTITDAVSGKIKKHFSYVTNHKITEKNIETIISSGRARWKIENECNNTLKNNGYNLEHNYGHGKNHLSSILTSFKLLSFFCHTIQSFVDNIYAEIREKLSSRKKFFNSIKELTTYLTLGLDKIREDFF